MKNQPDTQFKQSVSHLLSDATNPARPPAHDIRIPKLPALATAAAEAPALDQEKLPARETSKPLAEAMPPARHYGFIEAARFILNLVREKQPGAFYAKCGLSIAETTYQVVPLLLVAPFARSLTSGNHSAALAMGVALVGCWMVREWAISARDYINENFFRRTWRVCEDNFLERHLSRSLETIRSPEYSDKVTKVREQGNRLASFSQRLFDLSGNLVNVTAAAGGLAFYNPLAATGIIAVGTLMLINYVRYAHDFNTTEDSVAEVRRRYWHRRTHVSSPQSVRDIKLLGREKSALEALNESHEQLATPRLADTLRLTRRNYVTGTLSLAVSTGVLFTSAVDTALGNLPSEGLMQILSMTLYSGMQLALMSRSISDMLQDFVVVREALAIDQQGVAERLPGKEYKRLNLDKAPRISFDRVTYRPSSAPESAPASAIIEDLSLTLEPGKVYGLCGESGAGKTTLMRLLMREITPTSGQILFDDIPVEDIDPDDIKRVTRYLAQDFVDFESNSVEQTVSMGLHCPPEEKTKQIERAFKEAAVDFVDPGSLDTIIGVDFANARDFSGGERQRLAIARTIAGEASLLVLDEPTSRIDHDNEDTIFTHLLARDPERPRTVIIISHRFANLRNADHIFFLRKGLGIAEEGSHDQLLQKKGEYARLYRKEQENLD